MIKRSSQEGLLQYEIASTVPDFVSSLARDKSPIMEINSSDAESDKLAISINAMPSDCFNHQESSNSLEDYEIGIRKETSKCVVRDAEIHERLQSCTEGNNGNMQTGSVMKGVATTYNVRKFGGSYVDVIMKIMEPKPRLWDSDVICDLCDTGPSLLYGEWYSWCCGYRSSYCKCSKDYIRKLESSMSQKKKNVLRKHDEHEWSGKIHRMCGLWSSEVYENDDGKDQLAHVLEAVRRGKNLLCKSPDCRRYGATLGCRVKSCNRSFHYPCALKLSSQGHCRMWEGCSKPIACHEHKHVDNDCKSATSFHKLCMSSTKDTETHSPQNSTGTRKRRASRDIKISQADGTTQVISSNTSEVNLSRSGVLFCGINNRGNNRQHVLYLGQKLVSEDITHGMEAVKIPCTNDIDSAPLPSFVYIRQNRYSNEAYAFLRNLVKDDDKWALACNGCHKIDIHDPKGPISVHGNAKDGKRETDWRIDWQGEPMFGRLPYDRYGILQLGWLTIDIVECNKRCKCGTNCINSELQKGLKIPLEVFRTQRRGWGVRTLERIPRGKFVLEYVGEVLSEKEADQRSEHYPDYVASYLFNLDHPAGFYEDILVVDGFRVSNVARFLNHSCESNLSIYRVFTDILDSRAFRIGLYACRDIEIGEELTYDYKFIGAGASKGDPTSFECFCEAKNCRQR